MHVDRLLVALGIELDPPGVTLRHRVGVVVPDVDRCADRAIGDGHDDGQSQPGCVVDRLDHEEQALTRGRGVGTCPRGGGADGDRHGGELRLDVDELTWGELSALHERRQRLDNVRLRRDGIGADHLGPRQGDCLGDRARTLNLPEHRRPPRSADGRIRRHVRHPPRCLRRAAPRICPVWQRSPRRGRSLR